MPRKAYNMTSSTRPQGEDLAIFKDNNDKTPSKGPIYIRPGARCHRVFEKKSTFSCNAKSGAWKRKALPLFFRKKKEDFQLKHEQECWWKFSFKNQNFYTGSLYPLAKKNWLSVVKRVLWTPVPGVGCVKPKQWGSYSMDRKMKHRCRRLSRF